MRYLSAHYIFSIASPPLRYGIICIDDQGVIADVIDTGGKLEERERLEFYNGILVPGFVNAHCHLELSHLRDAVGQQGGLPAFLSSIGRIRPAGDEVTHAAAKAADNEMVRNGIVAVGDIANGNSTIPIKRDSRMQYHTFVETFGLDGARADTIFAGAQRLCREFCEAGLPASIVPHAVYSVSAALFELLGNHYAAHPGTIAAMHHQESDEELGAYAEGKGLLAETFRKNGFLPANQSIRNCLLSEMEDCLKYARQCLLVHNLWSSEHDIGQRLEKLKEVFWVMCPKSNLYIQNRLPDLSLFAKAGLNVCLGTDSLASNTGLSILEEMKAIRRHVPGIALAMLLQWATLNGARALGLEDRLGSFEKNKNPGINLVTHIDFARMQLSPESTVQVIA